MQQQLQKNAKEDRIAVLCLDVILFLFLGLGLYGSVWSMDDFDGAKIILFGYIGIPLAMLFFGLRIISPLWGRSFPKMFYIFLVSLGVSFIPGHLLLINALSSDEKILKRDVATATKVVTFAVQRGGLGILHKKRW